MNIIWKGSRQIPVSGKNAPACGYAIVSKQDYNLLAQYRWHGDKDGYPCRTLNVTVNGKRVGRQVKMHQDILAKKPGLVADHINRIKHDNRRENLRYVTHRENSFNRGAAGVFFQEERNRWYAHITVDGKSLNLGRYKQKQEAVRARKEAEVKYFRIQPC